jgi:hypothetical protein
MDPKLYQQAIQEYKADVQAVQYSITNTNNNLMAAMPVIHAGNVCTRKIEIKSIFKSISLYFSGLRKMGKL